MERLVYEKARLNMFRRIFNRTMDTLFTQKEREELAEAYMETTYPYPINDIWKTKAHNIIEYIDDIAEIIRFSELAHIQAGDDTALSNIRVHIEHIIRTLISLTDGDIRLQVPNFYKRRYIFDILSVERYDEILDELERLNRLVYETLDNLKDRYKELMNPAKATLQDLAFDALSPSQRRYAINRGLVSRRSHRRRRNTIGGKKMMRLLK